MSFNPDAFLSESSTPAFNPDEFLSSAQAEVPVEEGVVTDMPISQRPNTAKLFDPKVQAEWSPFIDALRESAVQGGQFGKASIDARVSDFLPGGASDQVEGGKRRYAETRDRFAKNFDLTNDEADDYLKHKFDLQTEAVSMDTFGQVHLKDDLLAKPLPEIEKAIRESKLPEDKKPNDVELAARLGSFKVNSVQNIRQNHPEFATELGLTGDVNEDFPKINAALNQNRTEQGFGGAAAGALRSAGDISSFAGSASGGFGAQMITGGGVVGSNEESSALQGAADLSAAPRNAQKRQESLNQISTQFNGDKLKIFGADAATIGGGLYSAAESIAITAATGGAASSIVPMRLLPTIGKAVKAGMAVQPVSTLYATRQASDTYDEAIKLGKTEEEATDLSRKAFGAEWGITTAFSLLGAGGLEDIGSKLTKEGIKKTWGSVGTSILKTNVGEQAEEGLINVLQTVAVDAKLHPELTMDDLKKRAMDTFVATAFATGPVSVVSDAGKNLFAKTTEELEVIADDTAKRNFTVEDIPLVNENESTPPPSDTPENQEASTPPVAPANESSLDAEVPSGISGDAVGAAAPLITLEATTLLTKIDEGSAVPVAMNEELEKLATDNGIELTDETEPQNVVDALREKQTPSSQQEDAPTIGSLPQAPTSGDGGGVEAGVEPQAGAESKPNFTMPEAEQSTQPSDPEIFGARRAITDEIRKRHGIPESKLRVSQTDQAALDEATLRIAENEAFQENAKLPSAEQKKLTAPPKVGQSLINEIFNNPRTASDKTETALLIHEGIRREDNLNVKRNLFESLSEGTSQVDREIAANEITAAREELNTVLNAIEFQGSKAGLALQGFKQITDRQFERSIMESDFMSWKNAKSPVKQSLSDAEIEQIRKDYEEIKKWKEAREKAEDAEELRRLSEEESEQVEYLEKKAGKTESRAKKRADIKRRITEANKRMVQRVLDPTTSFAGGDETMVKDFVALIYNYIDLGNITLQEVSAKMMEKYGEKIRPRIEKHYPEASKLHAELNAPEEPTAKSVRNMAEEFINNGVKGTAVLDAVAAKMEISREEAQKLFLNKSVAVKTRTALQDEMSRITRLLNLTNQIAALKRGERKSPAAKGKQDVEVERLTKERNRLLKGLKIAVAKDEDTNAVMIKQAEAAIERYNDILAGATDAKKEKVQWVPEKELSDLQDILATTKEAVVAMRKARKDNEAESVREKALKDSVKELEALVAKGVLRPKKAKPEGPDTLNVSELKARRAVANKAITALRNTEKTPEDRDSILVAAARKRTTEIQEIIKKGDYSTKVKVQHEPSDRLIEARYQEARVKEEWLRNRQRLNLKNSSKSAKVAYGIHAALQFRKIWVLGLDVMLLRQGIVYTANHPIKSIIRIAQAAKNFREKDELNIYESLSNLKRNPNAAFQNKAKQFKRFSPFDEGFKNKEDFADPEILKKLAKVRGLGTISEIVQAIERVNRTYFNLIANDIFNNIISVAPGQAPTQAHIDLAANAAMIAAGRGSFKNSRAETGIELANYALLSTRYYVARANLITFAPVFSSRAGLAGTKKIRAKIAWELYGKATISLASIMTVIASTMFDDDDEREEFISPTSSRFGVFNVNGIDYEVLGGVRPFINQLARTVAGYKVQDGGKKILRGEGASSFKGNLKTEWGRFISNRRNINLALISDTISGEYYGGKPVTTKSALFQLVTNINIAEDINIVKEYGMKGHPIQAGLSILKVHIGGSVRSKAFEEKKSSSNSIFTPVKQ